MNQHPLSDRDTSAKHFGVMAFVGVVMGLMLTCLAIPAAVTVSFTTNSIKASLDNIPSDLESQQLAQRTRLYDSTGRLIATFYDQNRVDVPLNKIAPVMVKAILDTEDARFYQHGALDLMGTLRALTRNSAGTTTQGGSTITQQLAKMTAVENATTDAERSAAIVETYQRKVQELRRAIGYEEKYSKDYLLNRYLNIAYFGAGAYGVESAAERYFSIPAAKLSTAQSALLAGLVQNPTRFDPTRFPNRAIGRRAEVLERMVSTGTITKEEAAKINKQPLALRVQEQPNGCIPSIAPQYCDYVRRFFLADPSFGKTVAERLQLLNGGGLTIKTNLKIPFQNAADRAVQSTVAPTDQAVSAMAMVEPGTGNVVAIAQSRPMGRDSSRGQTFLNYAVNTEYGDAGGFQPGSTFKLFTLAAALTQGLSPYTTFNSPPKVSLRQSNFRTCSGPYPDGSAWSPANSTSSGVMSMYTGMQQSVNTFFAQLEMETGICLPFQLARKMGITLPDDAQVPSFTLGVASANPLEIATAYATMAARGKYCTQRPISMVLNSKGGVFKDYKPNCHQVVTTGVADRINDILRGVMAKGGFGEALQLNKPSAAKTGTSENNKTVWFNGYTPTLATSAVVAGLNSEGEPTSLNYISLNGRYYGVAHGSTVAGPMWANAMRAVQNLIPYRDFAGPGGDPDQSGLPGVVGMSVENASAALRSAGFTPVQAGVVDGGGSGVVSQVTKGTDGKTAYMFISR